VPSAYAVTLRVGQAVVFVNDTLTQHSQRPKAEPEG
jgi:hypothetical protein